MLMLLNNYNKEYKNKSSEPMLKAAIKTATKKCY